MLPSAFVFLEALPLTPNGKVDRNALPAPDGSRLETAERFVAPSTANEKTLALIWAEILKLDKVGVHDNFFDLGGHSLLAIRLVSRLRKQFQPDLPIRIVFEAPTVAQLAARLELQDNKRAAALDQPKAVFSHLVELQVRPDRTPIFCFPYRCGVQGEYVHFTRLAQYLGSDYSFYGLQAKAADSVTPPHETVEELAAEYVREITDVEPVGPYYLIGDCAGAPEAYETARQLWGRGKQVGLLVLMDAHGPYWPKHYWRVGSYSIKDLNLLRTQLVSSRPWKLCAYLAEAVSFHLRESKELSIGNRLRYLTEKVLGRIRTVIPSPMPSQEPELTASEEQLLQHITLARRRYRANWPSDCYPGALAVVVNEQWYGFDRCYGWKGTAARGVEVYSIPGDHISYMLEHVPLVADRIRDCLDRARKGVWL
jgi:thioesterase domain-containing protein